MKFPAAIIFLSLSSFTLGQELTQPAWQYKPALLRPFWLGDVVDGESVLFIKQAANATAQAQVMFPILEILEMKNSRGDVTYEAGRDYQFSAASRTITLPAGSRIPSFSPAALRRPANTQKYALTHRDGNGEILFGAQLEYADMQTCVTYRHPPNQWKAAVPARDAKQLPKCATGLMDRQPLIILTLGDSISEGANASGMFNAAPYQPAYPELVRRGLSERTGARIEMHNLSVGGKDTAWGVTQIEAVVALKPHLVILAFGMNDSAGRSAEDYRAKTKEMIAGIRLGLPDCEFILVASMLGNRDWTRLQQDAFPQYRDALESLCQPGIALADLTSIWTELLDLKKDWDQTGNGVNHPNDFGHRIYAQVIMELLSPHPS